MSIKTIEDILPLVEKPSRYMGGEINQIIKDPALVKLRFALAFPDLYEIGTSHFGMQILYHILNAHEEIAAERVFAPGVDMEGHLRAAGLRLFSLESRQPLNGFDIVGFSLLYELNYTNMLTILELSGIPFYAAERDQTHPMIVAGGPCTCNPEPVADFFDAMVIGDGESVILQMAESWLEWKKAADNDKDALLRRWSQLEGVYVPSFFRPYDDDCGFQKLAPRYSDYTHVTRTLVADLDQVPFPETPIIPFGKPIHDRLRLEVARGCTRGCRFCQAGMIYRPVRERAPDALLALCDQSVSNTGYEDISLLSLSTGDYGCIVPLMERLMSRYATQNVAVSLPSLRAGTLTPELMKLIKTVRKTGFTIAPEAGSQRLRDVINKNISDSEIIKTVKDAFDLGWQVIKLYFMIGLPTESETDLAALVALVKSLRHLKNGAGRRGKINVSVATFIPKPHTPFQWASQLSLAESEERIRRLQAQLKLPGIQFKWQAPKVSWLDGIWARGNRKLSRLLVAAYQKGCRFDGWSDQFRFDLWQAAIEEQGVDPDFFTTRERDVCEPLPWDHIDTQVTKTFLSTEWENARKGAHTPDCRVDDCNHCGVCDFEQIEPLTHERIKSHAFGARKHAAPKPAAFKKLAVFYIKREQARFFGHLELVNIFQRALKRAGITVRFSEGFHPKPKISFDDPLPVGIESQQERLVISVPDTIRPRELKDALNPHLPAGLKVIDCRLATAKPATTMPRRIRYRAAMAEGQFDPARLKAFKAQPNFPISLRGRKGKLKKIDLKDIVVNSELSHTGDFELTLQSEPGKTVRPFDVLRHIFDLSDTQVRRALIVKLKET
ncbi:MAG: TIGR03960 family B12-binding radical SAM protein [Desulfobacterales bacterium]|nr:TIGR03960 family B12-binding radical SAM protein [Desulfobacterales bacterium]